MPLTNYYRNKLIDKQLRGVAYTDPPIWYIGLASAASASSVTEVTDGGVTRQAVAADTDNFSATQAEGSTAATSSGTTGLSSNNIEIEFIDEATDDVSAAYVVFWDAPSGGNACRYYAIKDSGGNPITRNWEAGDRVYIPAGDLEITLS
jgi:hypothetical protein